MAHRRYAPENDGERKTFARADAIDQAADTEQTDRVRKLKREDHPTVTNFSPTDFGLQRRFENADDLAIDVVDGRREEEERTYHPPSISNRGCTRINADRSVRLNHRPIQPPSTTRTCPLM